MTGSPSMLATWPDRDFWNGGAFITSADGEHVTFGKSGTFTVVERFLETNAPVFYLKDFYKNSYLAYIPDSFITISKANVLSWIHELSVDHQHLSPIGNDDDLYEKDFGLLKSSFHSGIDKVVLVSRESYEPFEGEGTIKRLIKKAFEFGTGIPYGIWNKNFGMIGSTPELLFDVHEQVLRTFALAGTAKSGEEEMLLQSNKDRHEHNLVIRDITEKLKDLVTDIYVHETKIHPYKNLLHLKTDIEAKVKNDIDYTQLTNTLSPTAALGGYPKAQSLKFLEGSNYCQKYPKRYFGSAFGLMNGENKEFVVAIRNVQWENSQLSIESGGGVVPESTFSKELEEIHLKRTTIRKHYL